MIFTERQITVRKGKATIDEPVILYRGDFEVSIKFTIMESKFRFKSGVNLVDSEKASFGQLAILAPYGGNVFSETVKCEDGTVTFTLTKEMIDQLEEVGLYSFQIRLFDYYRESRVSIPPVEFGIEVREPVASEDHDNSVNNAIVGYSIAKVVDPKEENVGPTFDANGQYNKTNWKTGDRISEGKLNKIEDALDILDKNSDGLDKRITNNYNVLNNTKADKAELDVERSRINTFVTLQAGSTTGDAELIDARVGTNGSIYNNLGTAIREQFNLLNNQSEFLCELGCMPVLIDDSSFEYGVRTHSSTLVTDGINAFLRNNKHPILVQDALIEVDNAAGQDIRCAVGLFTSTGVYIGIFLVTGRVYKNTTARFNLSKDAIINQIPEAANAYMHINIGRMVNGTYVMLEPTSTITIYKLVEEKQNIIDRIDVIEKELSSSDFRLTNDDFVYGAYLAANGFANQGTFGLLKTSHTQIPLLDKCHISLSNTVDIANYFYVMAIYDENDNFISLAGNHENISYYFTEATKTVNIASSVNAHPNAHHVRISIAYNPDHSEGGYILVPETVKISIDTSVIFSRLDELNNEIDEVNNRINELDSTASCRFSSISVIGDSITYGYGLSNISNERYTTLMANHLNTTVNNYGVSASKLSEIPNDNVASFTERVSQIDRNSDLIVVFGGTNDYWHKSTDIGAIDSDDISTMCGALNYIIDYLQTNFLGKDYLFVFPFNQYYAGVTCDTDHGHGTLNDFREAFISTCNRKGVPVLDLYSNSGMDIAHNTTVRNYYTIDGVHPNAAGHERLALLIANKINQL